MQVTHGSILIFRYFIIHKYVEYKVNFPLCGPPTPPSPPSFSSKKHHLWVQWVFLQNFCIRSQTCWWLFNRAFFPLGKRQLFNIIHVEKCRIYNIVIHKSVSLLALFQLCWECKELLSDPLNAVLSNGR